MLVNVCIDNTSYKNKQDAKRDVRSFSKYIYKRERELSLRDLVYEVGGNGKTFTPATFNGSRSAEDFRQMQIFCLDFDDGTLSFHQVLERCAIFHLPVTFGYETFSSTDAIPKFRIGFVHCVTIDNRDIALFILRILAKIFPEADKSCVDVARVFFGGKQVIYYDETESTFRVDELANSFQKYSREHDPKNFMRNQKQIVKDLKPIGLLQYGFFDISTYHHGVRGVGGYQGGLILEEQSAKFEDIANSSDIYIIELFAFSSKIVFSNRTDTPHIHQTGRCRKDQGYLITHLNKEIIYNRCKLWRDFEDGIHLEHNDRLLLAMNIIYIKGMERLFLSITGTFYDSVSKWKYDISYMKAHQYKPMSCDHCLYANECMHEKNLIQTVSGKKSIVKKSLDEDYVSIEEGYDSVKQALSDAIGSNDNAIHLIKAQTSIGKTRAYEELIKSGDLHRPVIIAVPLIILKEEIARRLTEKYIYQALSWEQVYLPKQIANEVKAAYQQGYYKEARKIITDYAKETAISDAEKRRLDEFLHWQEILEEGKQNIVMTHAQLMNLSPSILSNYEIIIDEDCLYTMLKSIGKISIDAVERLLKHGHITGAKGELIRSVLTDESRAYFRINLTNKVTGYRQYKIRDEMNEISIYDEDVNGFLNANVYHRTEEGAIEYFTAGKLPDQKITILSATLDADIYKLFFENRSIVVHEIPKVRYQGKLVQFTNHSLSRTDLKRVSEDMSLSIPELFQYLKEYVSDYQYGITFKDYENYLGELHLHFGNAIGVDGFKGMNGLIVGTPHLPESCYKLIGYYLGVPVMNYRLQRYRVEYGGYEFPLMSYENEILRKIQLYLISSDLEQCIGRSRLLRTDATVFLFSNFPCEQSEIMQEDYLTEKYVDESVSVTHESA